MLCPSPSRFSFPVLHSFLPFSFVSLKVHGWLPILEYAEVTLFTIQLLAVLLLYLFSQTGGIPLCRFESLSLLLPFLYFFILVPRGATHLRYEKSLIFLFFLLGRLTLEKDVPSLLFLVFFFVFFFWTVLIFSWLFLHAWGILSLFGSLWGSRFNFHLQSSDIGFFSFFSFFFSHKLLGLPFFLLDVFRAPSLYFFRLGYCDFLNLNNF